MPSTLEIQTIQKERLYDLLILEKTNPDIKIKGLSMQISKAKAVMTKEDIAYITELVDEEVGKHN